jgi:hypothetical protein
MLTTRFGNPHSDVSAYHPGKDAWPCLVGTAGNSAVVLARRSSSLILVLGWEGKVLLPSEGWWACG